MASKVVVRRGILYPLSSSPIHSSLWCVISGSVIVVGPVVWYLLGSLWFPDTFVLGLCEKRSLGRRSSRACWVRPHSGEPRHDSRPLVRPSQLTPSCPSRGRVLGRGARLRSTHSKVVFMCEGVMDSEGLPLNISRVPAAGQGLPRVRPSSRKLVMMRLDIYQELPREVTTARSSIDSFTGARRFVHRDTNVLSSVE